MQRNDFGRVRVTGAVNCGHNGKASGKVGSNFRPAGRFSQFKFNDLFVEHHIFLFYDHTKLEDYTIHDNPPGISGALVEGRICYDAFTLDNKVKAIYG